MDFWDNLGKAYWGSGDERYARTFADHVRTWSIGCPMPADNGNYAKSAWRTIECGIRLSGSWPNAVLRFLHSPSLPDSTLIRFLKASLEQAQHIRSFSTTGNWLTMEMNGLYTTGGMYPEFRDAAAWRNIASDTMYNQLTVQFLADGAQIELTPGYHTVALDNIRSIYDKAAILGRSSELPSDYMTRLEKGYDYLLRIMTPDRNCPRVNDSWDVGMTSVMKNAFVYYPDRTDFQWVSTQGTAGKAPDFTSCFLYWAGYAAMRSGWETNANYLCFDVGPLGYGHQHQDKLNVVLYGYGRELLFDDGGGQYETSAFRNYAIDTYGHSTVLVDGLPQRRQTSDRWANVSSKPLDCRWESNDQYDFAAGQYTDAYGSVGKVATHDRRVLFVKPDLFIVADKLTPADTLTHTYQARWQLRTVKTIAQQATGEIDSHDSASPNLSIVPLAMKPTVVSASGQTTPELAGWFFGHTAAGAIPATTVFHTKSGKGVQWLVTLLIPLKVSQNSPVADIQNRGKAGADVVLSNGNTYAIYADTASPNGISFVEKNAAGQVVRSIKGGTTTVQNPAIHSHRCSITPCLLSGGLLSGCYPNARVKLYDPSGRLVDVLHADANGNAQLYKKESLRYSRGMKIIDIQSPQGEHFFFKATNIR
jgi:hypothetical protein